MSEELEPKSATEEAESIISSEDNRNIRIIIDVLSLINLHSHLMTMREMRRRKIRKVAVNEEDEDILSALESRFKKIFDGVSQEAVELDISHREVQALGRSLPLIEMVIGEARRFGFPLSPGREKDFPIMLYQDFRKLYDSFVTQGGKDDKGLVDSINSWVKKFK